jgi:DNA-binding transcriptional LysR family regulator
MTRDAGSVRLTAKGQELLVHARRVLDATDGFTAAANQTAMTEGTLRLGVTEMIAQTWLRAYLFALKSRYPRLSVELTVDFSVNLEKGLADRSLDLALQNAPFSRLASGEVAIRSFDLVWVAAPDLGLGDRLAADALATHPVLTHARDTWLYDEITAHFATVQDAAPRIVPSTNLAACQMMVIDGMGIAALPVAMVQDDVMADRLDILHYDWVPAPLQFFARYDAERALRMVADAAVIAARIGQTYDHKN